MTKLAGILLGVAFLLLSSYQVALSLNWQVKNSPDPTTALAVVNYLRGNELAGSFTPAEQSHLQDVKNLLTSLSLVSWSLLIIVLLVVVWKKEVKTVLRWAGFALLALAVVGGLFALSFKVVFLGFHYIFFPQGNFLFPAESSLARTYPTEFFQYGFFQILLFSLLESVILLLLSSRLLPKNHSSFRVG